jgi:transposase
MQKRFITLKETEAQSLKKIWKTSSSSRERDRAQCILLSSKGYQIDQLAGIFEVRRDTISDWLSKWESYHFEGLKDAAKSGRPPIFDSSEEKK